MVHAPQVHCAIGQQDNCVVCCEHGLEALYPRASNYYYVDRRIDSERREFLEPTLFEKIQNLFGEDEMDHEFIKPDLQAPREYFIPEPYHAIEINTNPDIVICPRKRSYGADKNWGHWQQLSDELCRMDLSVFAAGAPDSSDGTIHCKMRAWDFPRFLDASIAAMLRAKLVIATDAGLAHLAVMCGVPLLLISYKNDLVAPGCDDVGNEYWPIKLDRYQTANHEHVPIDVLPDSWNDPQKVLDKTRSLLCES